MFLEYLTIQKTLLFSLIVLFANRAWNYYDKIADSSSGIEAVNKYGKSLLITSCLFFFLLGFAIALEFNTGK